jgi:hypothetical protein
MENDSLSASNLSRLNANREKRLSTVDDSQTASDRSQSLYFKSFRALYRFHSDVGLDHLSGIDDPIDQLRRELEGLLKDKVP